MVPPFDIFKKEPDGKLRWLEAAESLEAAQERVQKFRDLSPGDYIIFSQRTRNKILIGPDSYSRHNDGQVVPAVIARAILVHLSFGSWAASWLSRAAQHQRLVPARRQRHRTRLAAIAIPKMETAGIPWLFVCLPMCASFPAGFFHECKVAQANAVGQLLLGFVFLGFQYFP